MNPLQNRQNIQANIVDKAAKDIDNLFKKEPDLVLWKEKIISLLEQLNRIESKWAAARERQRTLATIENNGINPYLKGDGTESQTKLSYATLSLYNQKQNILQYEEVIRVIAESEIFLDRIRFFFTKQKIVYTLGFNYYSGIVEQKVDIVTMLKQASLGFDSKTQQFKMRISKSKGELKKALEDFQTSEAAQNEAFRMEETYEEDFKELRNWYLKQPKASGGRLLFDSISGVSQGHLYEAFVYLRENGKAKNILKNMDLLKSAIERSMNSTSGRQGGDVDNQQVKWYGASFAVISEIKNTLNKLLAEIETFIKSNKINNFKSGLKQIFTKDGSTLEKIERAGQEESMRQIGKSIKEIKH